MPAATRSTQFMSRLRSSFATAPALAQQGLQQSLAAASASEAINGGAAVVPQSVVVPGTVAVPRVVNSEDLTTQEKLALFDQVLTEVEAEMPVVAPAPVAAAVPVAAPAVQIATTAPVAAVAQPPVPPPAPASELLTTVAQAVPSVIQTQTDTLNPAFPVRSTAKEAVADRANVTPAEAGYPAGNFEVVPNPELEMPPEVSEYLQQVQDHQEQLPQEIVVADGSDVFAQPAYAKTPVVVLPITPQSESEGIKKNPTWSVRWLVEWSRKIMKMFSGKVIYKELEA